MKKARFFFFFSGLEPFFFFSSDDVDLIFTGGFYTQLFESNVSSEPLRIISLNTNLYYSPNHVTVNITDPANQLAWLEGILEASSQKKEKVGAMNRTHWHGLLKLWQLKKKKRQWKYKHASKIILMLPKRLQKLKFHLNVLLVIPWIFIFCTYCNNQQNNWIPFLKLYSKIPFLTCYVQYCRNQNENIFTFSSESFYS